MSAARRRTSGASVGGAATLSTALVLCACRASTLFPVAFTACSYEIVECSEDQTEFIREARAWVIEHADRIDANMDAHWKEPREASMSEVVRALRDAEISCGIGSGEADRVAATHIDPGNWIVIDVSEAYVSYWLELYVNHRWTQAALAELEGSTAPADLDAYQAALTHALPYESSLGSMGLLLVHEAAHEVLGDHSRKAKQKHREISNRLGDQASAMDFQDVDEIYALGWWTVDTSQVTWREKRDAYFSEAPR